MKSHCCPQRMSHVTPLASPGGSLTDSDGRWISCGCPALVGTSLILGPLAVDPNTPDYLGFLATSLEAQYGFIKPGFLSPFPVFKECLLKAGLLMASLGLFFPPQGRPCVFIPRGEEAARSAFQAAVWDRIAARHVGCR